MYSTTIPRIVIAGCASGAGKTTTVVALIRAFAKLGLRVAVFKCGPDYLDPTYHCSASGKESQCLDPWMMGRAAVLSTFERKSRGCDVAIIEGMMGLFDGASSSSNDGSTAQVAQWLSAPILLVLDVSAMARTALAIVRGLQLFAPELKIAGLIANFLGSPAHLEIIREACGDACVGGFIRGAGPSFPSRHLGLETASHGQLDSEKFDAWGRAAAQTLDLERILAIAKSAPPIQLAAQPPQLVEHERKRLVRIAIARDEAFHFYYDENLELLEQAGARLVEFSPLHDKVLPDCEGVYVGGGYPEVYAELLASNEGMRASIQAHAAAGKPIYAECGGLIALSSAVKLSDGELWPMWGVIAGQVTMHDRLKALGYIEVTTREASLLGLAGTCFRGHQFRYSSLELQENVEHEKPLYQVTMRRGHGQLDEGYRFGANVVASYVHAHWASNPKIAANFVDACATGECTSGE